jgi:iron complex outermembrane receptor protein
VGIDPVVRGFKYSQLNVQLNGGLRIEGGCPNRMDPATAHVDMNDLENITILKGPFEAGNAKSCL